jgi:hypothetical protein
MALSKIQAESMNLADTYAFTGTVSGAGETNDIVKLASTTVSSSVASVSFDGYFSSTYDHYKVCWTRLTPVGGSQLRIRLRQNNADMTSSIYRSTILSSYYDGNGSATTYSAGRWNVDYGELEYGDTVTNSSDEGGSNGHLYLYGALDSGDKFYIATEVSTRNDQYTIERPMINGYINTTGSLSGFSLYFNANNTSSGTVTLYGIK